MMLVFKGTLESDFEIEGTIADGGKRSHGKRQCQAAVIRAHEQFRKKPRRPKLTRTSRGRRSWPGPAAW
jgi:hypothetical protein